MLLRRMFSTSAVRGSISASKRILVKCGSAVVVRPDGKVALARMGGLVENLCELQWAGKQVMLVSSGAVGAGRERVGFSKDIIKDQTNVAERQASAAAGQEILMSTYNVMFQRNGVKVAQVLVTQDDFLDYHRYLALNQTLDSLCSRDIIPIINENDMVTGTFHLNKDTPRVFEDNDMLAAVLAAGSEADGLAMMSDVDGVFTKPPWEEGAERISTYDVDTCDVEIGSKSSMGRGGMGSKINAAALSAKGGVETVVANGYDPDNICRIFKGQDIGTLFPAVKPRPNASARWLSFFVNTAGAVQVKKEVADKILSGKHVKMMLSVEDVEEVNPCKRKNAHFGAGDAIRLLDPSGKEFARGITQISSEDIKIHKFSRPIPNAHLCPLIKPGEVFVHVPTSYDE